MTWEPAAMEWRQCEHCGGDFITHSYRPKRFCNRKCAGAWRSAQNVLTLVTRECPHCGGTFTVQRETDTKKYCSHRCYSRARTAANKAGKRLPRGTRRPPKMYPRVCRHCDRPFQSKSTQAEFCSTACRNGSQTAKLGAALSLDPLTPGYAEDPVAASVCAAVAHRITHWTTFDAIFTLASYRSLTVAEANVLLDALDDHATVREACVLALAGRDA